MNLAHYEALTARAFDRFDAASDDEVVLDTQHSEQVARVAAALGRVILHLGVPGLGVLALWLNT